MCVTPCDSLVSPVKPPAKQGTELHTSLRFASNTPLRLGRWGFTLKRRHAFFSFQKAVRRCVIVVLLPVILCGKHDRRREECVLTTVCPVSFSAQADHPGCLPSVPRGDAGLRFYVYPRSSLGGLHHGRDAWVMCHVIRILPWFQVTLLWHC